MLLSASSIRYSQAGPVSTPGSTVSVAEPRHTAREPRCVIQRALRAPVQLLPGVGRPACGRVSLRGTVSVHRPVRTVSVTADFYDTGPSGDFDSSRPGGINGVIIAAGDVVPSMFCRCVCIGSGSKLNSRFRVTRSRWRPPITVSTSS